MPIAAVPHYVGNDFSSASPGLRFGMYLKLWGIDRRTEARLWTTHDIAYEERGPQRQERDVKYENKVSALADAQRFNPTDKQIMRALLDRQSAVFDSADPSSDRLRFDAVAVSPFTTGLGNEHPLENGFAFLNPYGLPYLPGSGVKGVLRQAGRELARGEWGERRGWSEDAFYSLQLGKERIPLSVIDVLFGLESGDGDTEHVRGALSFWDVIPQIEGTSLMVEIMTPHQSHYYQQKRDDKSGDSTSPHDSGQPNPICFLTVPPGSRFAFHVVCDVPHLRRLTSQRSAAAPDLLAEGDSSWKTLISAAFEHAFAWLGFGAKTAVGYGALKIDTDAQDERKRKAAERREEERLRSLSEESRQIEALRVRLQSHQGRKQPVSGVLYRELNTLLKAALDTPWPDAERAMLADLIDELGFAKIDFQRHEKDVKRKLRQLRGQS